jgi:SP family xylose:H+ symportor-like MFS transporter
MLSKLFINFQFQKIQSKTYNNRYIIGISFISALGGYLFGFDFVVISGALPFLRTQFALTPE